MNPRYFEYVFIALTVIPLVCGVVALVQKQAAKVVVAWGLAAVASGLVAYKTPSLILGFVIEQMKDIPNLKLTPEMAVLIALSVVALSQVVVIAIFHKLLIHKPQELEVENKQAAFWKSQWAKPTQLSDMVMSPKSEHGEAILLGVHQEMGKVIGVRPGTGGRLELGHTLVVGPSRSGKGLLLTRNALNWKGSMVFVDIKGDLYRTTAGYRNTLGKVFRLDPSGQGHRYDPFKELAYSSEALRSAAALIMQTEQDGSNKIFGQRASSALFAGLRGAFLEGRPTLLYLRELTRGGIVGYVQRLIQLDDEQIRDALVDFIGTPPELLTVETFQDDRFLSSSWQNMITRLGPLFSQGILQMTSGNDFYAKDLFSSPCSLYLVFNESELEFTGLAFRVMLLAMITALIRVGDICPEEVKETILFAFDEAGRVPIPKLPDLLSTVAGRGMTAMVFIQALSQLEHSYEKDGAATIRGNCHTQVFYRPEELKTAEYISERCGNTTLYEEKRGVSSGESNNTFQWMSGSTNKSANHSIDQRERALITTDEIMLIPSTQMFVFASGHPPMQLERFEPFRIASLKKRMAMLAPKVQSLTSSPAPKPVEVLPAPVLLESVVSSVDSAVPIVPVVPVVPVASSITAFPALPEIPSIKPTFEVQVSARRSIPNKKRSSNESPTPTESTGGV
jgi:type IV secretion system protein VirD4